MIKCIALSKQFRKNGLRRRYIPILKHISFEVPPYSTTGITGESGCGKTTLARCLINIIKPDEGTIFINGTAIGDYKTQKEFYRHIQMVQQNPESALDPDMSVQKSLYEVYAIHKDLYSSKDDFEHTLHNLCVRCRIDDTALDKLPYAFSGGQLQRLCIIRSLLVRPQILILDEPTSMLDVTVQAEIMALLQALKETYRLTFIFISHDLDLIEYFCDTVIVMKNGEIIEQGACMDVFKCPRREYTMQLLKSRNLDIREPVKKAKSAKNFLQMPIRLS